MPANAQSLEDQLIGDIAQFDCDPAGYAKYAFPWGEAGELSEAKGLREWQAEILETVKGHLTSPARFEPLLIAVSSGHGIGKSALIAILANWGLSTCEDCRIVVTANTEPQLRTKTWPEISKWFGLAINKHWWEITATTVSVREKGHERLWRMDAIAWSENNTEAFAGLHNKRKRIIIVFDEGSAISDKIWEVTEGALTDEETEIIWVVFGNPTRNFGRFKECFGKNKHRWVTRQIDSRTVEGTNKAQLDKWIADYGADSDFVRVRVRGEFPRAGSTQFIAGDTVSEARKRTVEASGFKVLSVDVARFGDDQTVLGMRQGHRFDVLARFRGLDTVEVSQRVMEVMRRENPRATIIDGDGIGGGVVDRIRHDMVSWFKANPMHRLQEFHGGSAARDGHMYFNHRAEVWGLMRDWLKEGSIPDEPEIETDLTGPEYYFSPKNQIQLERKEDMKRRGLASPDTGDTLAMSFAANPAELEYDEQPTEEEAAFLAKADKVFSEAAN